MDLISFSGDLRKRLGADRVQLTPSERVERIRVKSKAWDERNMEKRRLSDRMSKRRNRALYGRERDPGRPRFLSLDAERTDSGDTLHNVIGDASLSPAEILMMKEEAE